MSPKAGSRGKEFSEEREFKVILESLEGQFKVFGEGLQDLRSKLDRVKEKVDVLGNDMAIVKAAIPPLYNRVASLESSR